MTRNLKSDPWMLLSHSIAENALELLNLLKEPSLESSMDQWPKITERAAILRELLRLCGVK